MSHHHLATEPSSTAPWGAPQEFKDFSYLDWPVLDDANRFEDLDAVLNNEELIKHRRQINRKTRLIWVAHRNWTNSGENHTNEQAFQYFKETSETLKERFDGFSLWELCLPLPYGKERLRECLQFVARHCHVYLASPYDMIHERTWLRYEAVTALKRRRLILNTNSLGLLEAIQTTQPDLLTAQNFVRKGKISDCSEREILEESLKHEFDLPTMPYDYLLIETESLIKESSWVNIKGVPILESNLDLERVLMISHKWERDDHPDPSNTQLEQIKGFLNQSPLTYDYVFYDMCCLDQSMPIQQMEKVDSLFAQCPCLCLTTERYFYSSWCLFELCINSLNRGKPALMGDTSHRLLEWLDHARMVRDVGYAHSLPNEYAINDIQLQLPTDGLHLKSQLRSLFMSRQTTITNNGDRTIILNLLDKLI